MDNCGGQNKNQMVLRMLHYLVKLKVAVEARIIFLFIGHAKNDCDRLFNLMKKEYRKCNIYTPKDLTASMQHELIGTVIVNPNDFRDWDNNKMPSLIGPRTSRLTTAFLLVLTGTTATQCTWRHIKIVAER